MKTPSQRAKGRVKRPRLKTQLEVDIDNGFDGSGYEIPGAANYRTIKNAMDRQRRRNLKEILKRDKELAKKEAMRKAEEIKITKQETIYNKNKTVFDVIDIDD